MMRELLTNGILRCILADTDVILGVNPQFGLVTVNGRRYVIGIWEQKFKRLMPLGDLLDGTQLRGTGATLWTADVYRRYLQACKSSGARFGSFLAKLHSGAIHQTVLECFPELKAGSPSHSATYRDPMMEFITVSDEKVLRRFREDTAADSGLWLPLGRVAKCLLRKNELVEQCVAMHGCTPSSFRVAAFGDILQQPDQTQPATVDVDGPIWKFSMSGRGITGNMVQLLAHLLVTLFLHRHCPGPFKSGTEEFIDQLLENYADRSEVVAKVRRAIELKCRKHPVWHVVQSTVERFGAEIILNVVGQQSDNHYFEYQATRVMLSEQRELVRLGTWYMDRAGRSVKDMLEWRNWEEFRREEHMIMLRLFRISPGR